MLDSEPRGAAVALAVALAVVNCGAAEVVVAMPRRKQRHRSRAVVRLDQILRALAVEHHTDVAVGALLEKGAQPGLGRRVGDIPRPSEPRPPQPPRPVTPLGLGQ